MKKIISILIVSILVNFIAFHKIYKISDSLNNLTIKYNQDVEKLNHQKSKLIDKENKQLEIEGHQIKDVQLKDINGKTNNFSSIINKETIFILRKPRFSCDDCFIALVKSLHKILDNKRNLLIVFSFEDQRDFEITIKLNNLTSFKVYNTTETIIEYLDKSESNYFLSLDGNLAIMNLYIPSTTNKKGIEEYIKFIMRKLK